MYMLDFHVRWTWRADYFSCCLPPSLPPCLHACLPAFLPVHLVLVIYPDFPLDLT